MALGDRGENSREFLNPTLFEVRAGTAALVQEWYYRALQMSSNCLNGRGVQGVCPAPFHAFFLNVHAFFLSFELTIVALSVVALLPRRAKHTLLSLSSVRGRDTFP